MLEKEAFGTMQKLNRSWYEAVQTMAHSTFDMQGRSVQYLQSVMTDGIETLKGHIEITRHLLNVASKPQEQAEQQETMRSFMEGSAEIWLRTASYLQRTVERGGETYRGNAETMRELSETLLRKAQEQQSALWS